MSRHGGSRYGSSSRFRAPGSISWRHLGCLALQFAVVPLVVGGCSRPAQTPPVVTQAPSAASENAAAKPLVADAPPAALTLVGESAEGLFDAARASQWPTATTRLQALNEAASQLPSGLPTPDLVAQLGSRIE